MRPTIPAFGPQCGLHFVLDDRLAGSYQALRAVADSFLVQLNKRPEILTASTTLEPDFPKYELSVDQDKAIVMGVNIKEMLGNVRQYYSRVRISTFNLFNRQNSVYLQAAPKFSRSEERRVGKA